MNSTTRKAVNFKQTLAALTESFEQGQTDLSRKHLNELNLLAKGQGILPLAQISYIQSALLDHIADLIDADDIDEFSRSLADALEAIADVLKDSPDQHLWEEQVQTTLHALRDIPDNGEEDDEDNILPEDKNLIPHDGPIIPVTVRPIIPVTVTLDYPEDYDGGDRAWAVVISDVLGEEDPARIWRWGKRQAIDDARQQAQTTKGYLLLADGIAEWIEMWGHSLSTTQTLTHAQITSAVAEGGTPDQIINRLILFLIPPEVTDWMALQDTKPTEYQLSEALMDCNTPQKMIAFLKALSKALSADSTSTTAD